MKRRKLAPVVFDFAVLQEPRACLEYARKHLAILRDEEVAELYRTEAADTANRIASRAADALVRLRDDVTVPPAVQWLAYHLIAEVNVVLRESYDYLHPALPPKLAMVRRMPAAPERMRNVQAANDVAA